MHFTYFGAWKECSVGMPSLFHAYMQEVKWPVMSLHACLLSVTKGIVRYWVVEKNPNCKKLCFASFLIVCFVWHAIVTPTGHTQIHCTCPVSSATVSGSYYCHTHWAECHNMQEDNKQDICLLSNRRKVQHCACKWHCMCFRELALVVFPYRRGEGAQGAWAPHFSLANTVTNMADLGHGYPINFYSRYIGSYS